MVSWAAIASPILGFPWRFDGVSWNVSGPTCIRNFWGSDAASILRAFGQGRAFQVRLQRFAARADARTSPSCVVFIPPGRPSTPIHTIRSVVCRSEHPPYRLLRDSRSIPQACSIRRSNGPLPDKHCYYDPITSPCGVGVDAEKGAMPALDLQSLTALRIGWLQTS